MRAVVPNKVPSKKDFARIAGAELDVVNDAYVRRPVWEMDPSTSPRPTPRHRAIATSCPTSMKMN
jgi:hypothetical protein